MFFFLPIVLSAKHLRISDFLTYLGSSDCVNIFKGIFSFSYASANRLSGIHSGTLKGALVFVILYKKEQNTNKL